MDLQPGLYDSNYELIYTWEELITEEYLDCRKVGEENLLYYFENSQRNGNLILSDEIGMIDYDSLSGELLNSIYIPSSVSNIDNYNYGIGNVRNINVNPNNLYYSSEDGVLFNKHKTRLIRYPFFKENLVYRIPASVTKVCQDAFAENYDIQQIICNKNLKQIGNKAFHNCIGLKSFFLNDGIEELGNAIFSECEKLNEIILPKSIKRFNGDSFANCNLKVKYIGSEFDFVTITNYSCVNLPKCNYIPTLEDLISMGYSFREVNKIIKNMEIEK